MRFYILLSLVLITMIPMAEPGAGQGANDQFVGRWDVTIPAAGESRARYCWLEVTKEGAAFKARFNSGGGAVFPLTDFSIENGELKFQHRFGKPDEKLSAVYLVRVKNGQLEGTVTFGKLPPRPLTGVRGPEWPVQPPKRKAGKPIDLFNGKDLTGWLGQNTDKPTGWTVQDGVMVNGDSADNIYTERKFRDFKLEVEFFIPPKSNSGVYLRGRYEIQVMDGTGRPKDIHSPAALYGFIIPSSDAEKPGDWQRYEITLIANRVTVVYNGVKVIDNGEIPGITGGALDANEKDPGPIMLQGDHGLVKYRKVQLTPLE